MLRISALLLVVVLAGAPMAWAEPPGDLEPNAIRKKIQGLRTLYTDEHPDVILLQRKLEKAEEIERQRKLRRRNNLEQTKTQPQKQGETGRLSTGQPTGAESNQ